MTKGRRHATQVILTLLAMITVLALLSACSPKAKNVPPEPSEGLACYEGTVIAPDGGERQGFILVEAKEGTDETAFVDMEEISIYDTDGRELMASDITVGTKVAVYYSGNMARSYPPMLVGAVQINVLDR